MKLSLGTVVALLAAGAIVIYGGRLVTNLSRKV